MTVGIDASRAADPQKTGVGWYCYHLLQHLPPVIPSDVRVVLYTDAPLPDALRPFPRNWTECVLPWPPPVLRNGISNFKFQISNFARWPFWSQVRLAERVLRDRPDVLFVPAHVIPEVLALAPRSRRPLIVTTIHDVAFRSFPDAYSPRERWYADHATRLAARHADRIIVPTQHVAEELERWYGVDPTKVAVVHHGVETIAPRDVGLETRDQTFDLTSHVSGLTSDSARLPTPPMLRGAGTSHISRLILYVGRLERKKNVVRIVEAFNVVAGDVSDTRLVLVGTDGYGSEDVHTAIARSAFRDRIFTPGWIDAAMYRTLLARAAVFCFPTLAEGFGMPILEAMAAGVPVITSRGGAHEEVAGDAAMLVDPGSVGDISTAFRGLLRDDTVRLSCVTKGKQRAAQFSWQRAAVETWGQCTLDTMHTPWDAHMG